MIQAPSLFELRGLELADSIELAQSTLRGWGLDVDRWTHADTDALELILDLLQGIPSALLEVLPQIISLKVPIREFYQVLEGGVFRQLISVDPKTPTAGPVYLELVHICKTLPDHLLAPLLALGVYWREGPYQITLLKDLVSLGLCAEESHAELIIGFARDRGYLQVGDLDRISWIHPLFTVYTRFLAATIMDWKLSAHKLTGIKFLVESSLRWIESKIRPRSRTSKSARLVLSYLNVDTNGKNSSIAEVDAMTFANMTLEGLDFQWRFRTFTSIIKGLDFEDFRSYYLGGLQNGITCINICLREPLISLENWPKSLFYRLAMIVRGVGSTAEIALCANHFEKLVECFIKINNGVTIAPEHQAFILSILNFLAAVHRERISLPDRRHDEFIQLATDIISASEQEYGEMTDHITLYEKGCVLRHQTLSFLEQRKPKEAVETWAIFLELDKCVNKLLEDESKAKAKDQSLILPETTATFFINSLSQDKDEAEIMRQRLLSVSNYEWEKAFYESRKESMKYIQATANIIESENYDYSDELRTGLQSFNPGYIKIAAAAEKMGISGLEKDPRSWPEFGDLAAHYTRYDDPIRRLAAIEEAADSGSWVDAIEHHRTLMLEAFREGDFDEVLEHSNAVIRIYGKDPLFASALEEAEARTQVFVTLSGYWHAIHPKSSVGEDAKSTARKAFESIDALVIMLQNTKLSALPGSEESLEGLKILREVWLQEAQSDNPIRTKQILRAVASSTEGFKRIIKPIFKNANNPDFLRNLMVTYRDFMKLDQQIYNADRSGKPEDLERALNLYSEVEKMAETEFGRELIDIDEIPHDKEVLAYKREFNTSVLNWHEATKIGDWAEALRQRRISASLKESHAELHAEVYLHNDPKAFRETFELTESMYWNQLFEAASVAFLAKDYDKSVKLYDELLELYEKGTFEHLDPDQIAKTVKGAKSSRLISLISMTSMPPHFRTCMKHCDEWLELNAEDIKDKPQSHDHVIDARETAEIGFYNNEYLRADYEMDFARAMMWVGRMNEVCDRMKRTPDVKRSGSNGVTQELLDAITQQLAIKLNLMHQFGPVLGRQIIQSSRDTIGYRSQFV
jgi:hypothetical protein